MECCKTEKKKKINCFHLARFTHVQETQHTDDYNNVMLELCNYKETFSCKSVTIPEDIAVDDDFEIRGKISNGKIIKIVTSKEQKI